MFQRVCMRMTAHLLVAATILAALGCGGAPRPSSEGVAPELRLEGVRFRIYRGDVLRAEGVSETASLRRDSAELRARNLEAALPRGAVPVRITAPAGEGSLVSRTFTATGGVVVSRGDDAARTERARYEPEHGLVSGDDPVVVSGRGYRLEGNGFTLDPAAGSIAVRGGARLLAGLPEAR
jgi:lipopolysaccharide export system protein LptC